MNSVIEMKKKRNNTIKIIGIGLGIMVLYLGVSFYFQWSEGAPKIRYKSEELNYILEENSFKVEVEDSKMERTVSLVSAVSGERLFSVKLYHYRYDDCESKRIDPDVSEYQKYAISDMTTIRNYAYRFFNADTADFVKVNRVIREVQAFTTTLKDFEVGRDIPKFFLQTLYDGGGNSANKSIMLAAILKYLKFSSVLLYDDEEKVMYVGIALADDELCNSVEYNGIRYGIIDVCTIGKKIGSSDIKTKGLRVLTAISDDDCNLKFSSSINPAAVSAGDERNTVTVDYKMKRLFGHPFAKFQTVINEDDYAFYSSLPRTNDGLFEYYLSDIRNKEIIADLVSALLSKYTGPKTTEWFRLSVITNFVHNIPYANDADVQNTEEYAQFPVETLYNNSGDCEDHAILMAAMLKELGYDCCFVKYQMYKDSLKEDTEGHVIVAVKDKYDIFSGTYYEINGEKYYALETTAPGYSVGLLKKGFRDSLVYDCGIVEMIE